MGAGFLQDFVGVVEAPRHLFIGEALGVGEGVDIHIVGIKRNADAPAAGLERLADARHGVVHLDHRLDRVHVHHVQVLVDHEGLRPGAVLDLVAGDRCVGNVALLLGVLFQDIDHRTHEAGGAADLDALLLQPLDDLGDTGEKLGVLAQTIELHRHEVREHVIDVALVGVLALDLLPTMADLGDLRQRLDVQVLAKPHRPAGLEHGNLDAVLLEHLEEDDRRGQHVRVGDGAAPIQHQGLYLAPIAALINEVGIVCHVMFLVVVCPAGR